MPNKSLREVLKLTDKQPVFYKERVTFDAQHIPVEFVEIYYNAEIYRYKVSMSIKKD